MKLLSSKKSLTPKQSFNVIIDSSHLNQFCGRKIFLKQNADQLELDSTIEQITSDQITALSSQINHKVKSLYHEHFSDQDFSEFINQIIILSQSRLDFLLELLELQTNTQENWPFLQEIYNNLPSNDLPHHFAQVIQIANSQINLESINLLLNKIEVTTNSFYNLYFIATNLESHLLQLISLDSSIFYLDNHKLIQLVRILNRDPFLAKDLIVFLNHLGKDVQSTKSYVSLITNPLITNIHQLRFIHTIYKNIDKPFTDKEYILQIILKEDYITLDFYLSFFKKFTQRDLVLFVKKIKNMSIIEKLKLEIGLLTSTIKSIKQIINA